MLSFHDKTENWTAENRCFHTDIYYVAKSEIDENNYHSSSVWPFKIQDAYI
jgi:hypothetical protein